MVVRRPHRLVFIHANLLDDDVFFHLEVIIAQAGAEDIGQDIHGLGNVFGENRGVEDGVLFARERVVVSADSVKVSVHVQGGASRRPLEHHMLQEVRHAGDAGAFVP